MTTWQAIVSTATQSSRSGFSAGSETELPAGFVVGRPAFPSILRPLACHAAAAWKWLERKRTQQLATRRLRVAETIQLGEKRFVSILQVDGAQFLIAGAAGNISLLAILNNEASDGANSVSAARAATEVTPCTQ